MHQKTRSVAQRMLERTDERRRRRPVIHDHSHSSRTYLTERIHRLLDARQIDRAFVHPHFDCIVDDTLDSNKDLHGCLLLCLCCLCFWKRNGSAKAKILRVWRKRRRDETAKLRLVTRVSLVSTESRRKTRQPRRCNEFLVCSSRSYENALYLTLP